MSVEPSWTYNIDEDTWVSTDGGVAIDGVVIRQLARQVLRTRRARAFSSLESRFGRPDEANPAYRQALVNVLSSEWALPLAS
jgi:hypothetical protein